MRDSIFKQFICPMCKSNNLILDERDKDNIEIEDGKIICQECHRIYPISHGIPYFFTDTLRQFVEKSMPHPVFDNDFIPEEAGSYEEYIVLANVYYHDATANTYDKKHKTDIGIHYEGSGSSERIDEVVRYLSARTDSAFWLDVGVGTGNVLLEALKMFRDGVGVDVSTEMLRKARDNGLPVVFGDGLHLPFADSSASVVSAFSTLHHLASPTRLLKEMARVLRKGGFIYTDWDSNAAAIYDSRILRIVRRFRKSFLSNPRSDKKQPQVGQKKDGINKAHQLAEIHHPSRGGLAVTELVECLMQIGFKEINIFYYDRSPKSLFKNSISFTTLWKTVIRMTLAGHLVWPRRDRVAPRFAILARKENQ